MMTGEDGGVSSIVKYGSSEENDGYQIVPLGNVLYITSLVVKASIKGNKEAHVILYEREGILDTSAPMDPRRVLWQEAGFKGEVTKRFKSHIKSKQLTDLWFRATRTDATGVSISVSLYFYLLDRDASGAQI